MSKFIIDMPEGWDKDSPIDDCPLLEHGCGEFGLCTNGCPLANAKEAKEITTDEMETYDEPSVNEQTINGKPVKLFAVTEDK